ARNGELGLTRAASKAWAVEQSQNVLKRQKVSLISELGARHGGGDLPTLAPVRLELCYDRVDIERGTRLRTARQLLGRCPVVPRPCDDLLLRRRQHPVFNLVG